MKAITGKQYRTRLACNNYTPTREREKERERKKERKKEKLTDIY